MPTHYPAGPWIRAVLFSQSVEKQYQNDLWFKATGSIPPTTDVNAIAGAISSVLGPLFAALMNSNCGYIGCTAYLNNGTFTWSAENNDTSPGTGAGTLLPAEVATIVRINSGVATRAGNGRIFCSCIDSTMASDSNLSGLGATNMAALCTGLIGITILGAVTCQLAVWSRKLGVLENVIFADPNPILGHRRKRRPLH